MLGWLKNLRSFTTRTAEPAIVPAGVRLYAIGDVHGRLDLLQVAHAGIKTDMHSLPANHTAMVVHLGDYIDRGPNSKGVLDYLCRDPLPEARCVYLKGNHEAMALRFIDSGADYDLWAANGGKAFLASYGVSAEGPPQSVRARLRAAMPAVHYAFLSKLLLSAEVGGYYFVHAGINPARPLTQQREQDQLWIREPFLSHPSKLEKTIIHGHSVTSTPQRRAHRIGIDTGGYITGNLTTLVLEGASQRYLNTALRIAA
jgi:serine/threonine protein phosphatase 1